tara:strand:- start:2256 stop:2699 length:444 start_codon:yes stop_codon:yes gene_type:complete
MRFVSNWALKFSLLIFSLFYLAGCGSAATDQREHIPLHGQITLNSISAGDGVISFIPAKDNANGSPASTNILAGKYRFNGTEGPSAGRYRVRINPPLPTKEPPPSKESTENANPISGGPWEFELTVTEDLATKGADFELSKQTGKNK